MTSKLTEKVTKMGRPTAMKSPWGDLSLIMGGYKNLALHFGVGTSTITKWAKGIHRIPAMAQKELEKLCRDYKINL